MKDVTFHGLPVMRSGSWAQLRLRVSCARGGGQGILPLQRLGPPPDGPEPRPKRRRAQPIERGARDRVALGTWAGVERQGTSGAAEDSKPATESISDAGDATGHPRPRA